MSFFTIRHLASDADDFTLHAPCAGSMRAWALTIRESFNSICWTISAKIPSAADSLTSV
jgi:hypothetical protein